MEGGLAALRSGHRRERGGAGVRARTTAQPPRGAGARPPLARVTGRHGHGQATRSQITSSSCSWSDSDSLSPQTPCRMEREQEEQRVKQTRKGRGPYPHTPTGGPRPSARVSSRPAAAHGRRHWGALTETQTSAASSDSRGDIRNTLTSDARSPTASEFDS